MTVGTPEGTTDAAASLGNEEPHDDVTQAEAGTANAGSDQHEASPGGDASGTSTPDNDPDFHALPGSLKEALRNAPAAVREAQIKVYKSMQAGMGQKRGEETRRLRELERLAEYGSQLEQIGQNPKARAHLLNAIDALKGGTEPADDDDLDLASINEGKQLRKTWKADAERAARRVLEEERNREMETRQAIAGAASRMRERLNGRISDQQWTEAVTRARDAHGDDAVKQSFESLVWPEVIELLSQPQNAKPTATPRAGRPASAGGQASAGEPKPAKPWEARKGPATAREVLDYLKQTVPGWKEGSVRKAFRPEDTDDES